MQTIILCNLEKEEENILIATTASIETQLLMLRSSNFFLSVMSIIHIRRTQISGILQYKLASVTRDASCSENIASSYAQPYCPVQGTSEATVNVRAKELVFRREMFFGT